MKSFRLNRVIFSACAIVLGIVLLIWPERSLFIISKCIGVFLAGGGLAAAYMYYRDHDSAVRSVLLVLAAVMLICGAVIFMHPEELIKLIPTIVGILVMISGMENRMMSGLSSFIKFLHSGTPLCINAFRSL